MLISALMVSIGAQWAVLQSAAWVGMMVSYSIKAGSVTEGLSETFDGEHPCPMCKLVDKGEQSEKKDPTKEAKKLTLKQDLFADSVIESLSPPRAVAFPHAADEALLPRLTFSPPVPPPRCGAAHA